MEEPKHKEAPKLHPRNKHHGQYDFTTLIGSCPELEAHLIVNKYGNESIDFFDPMAVKTLNKALLQHYYGLVYWDIPPNYLCPPIPGRADYIHYIADLLAEELSGSNSIESHKESDMKCLDIGVGANCVYPIIGTHEYGWSFIGTDIDANAIASANKIVGLNPVLSDNIEIRHQANYHQFFKGILKKDERIDITICNPPFHSSSEEATAGSLRKLRNLHGKKEVAKVLNFGGRSHELWYKGGEERFVRNMIFESKDFASQCAWFSSLISKESYLKNIYKILKKVGVSKVKTISMGQGNKKSRIVAWTFINSEVKEKS